MLKNKILQKLKGSLKKIKYVVSFYNWFQFIKSVRAGDLRDIFRPFKIKLIFTVKPYTMLWYPRLSTLYNLTSYLEKRKIKGSFVECGVWNGGSGALISVLARNNPNRHTWLFDSWKGQPQPTKEDISYNGFLALKGMDLGFLNKVEEILFKKFKLNPSKIHLIKGWFAETLSRYREDVGEIALLHLDCDLYQSVKTALKECYGNVVLGGFIVIDDYGYWKGCKKAVDEFIKEEKLTIKLIKIDYTGVYFQKQ